MADRLVNTIKVSQEQFDRPTLHSLPPTYMYIYMYAYVYVME